MQKFLTFPNLHSSELSFPTLRVGTICDPVILQSTFEARILLPIVTFSMSIFGVESIERLIEFILDL